MKVNVFCIVRDHFGTLRNGGTDKFSLVDLAVFFILPILIGFLGYKFQLEVRDALESSLIAVFSVFAALLFSAQIALYGLFSKDIHKSSDDIEEARNELRRRERSIFFREVNANVSYLILFSVVALVWLLMALAIRGSERIEDAITIALTTHFIATLLMLIKRVHIAFAATYLQG